MIPLRSLVRTERMRLLRRPMTWILGVILGGLTGMVYLSLTLTLLLPEGDTGMTAENTEQIRELVILPEGFGSGLGLVTGFLTIMLIILAAGVFGSEFSWGTVRTSLMTGLSRERFYAGKIIALLILSAAALAVAAFVTLGASIAAGVIVDGSFYVDEWLTTGFLFDALLIIFRSYIGVAVWVLIASTIALVTHSLAAGVGITLAQYFLGDIMLALLRNIGDIGEWVARLFPNEAINALLSLNSADPPTFDATDAAWVIANLVFYAGAAVLTAIIRFRKMDVIAASG